MRKLYLKVKFRANILNIKIFRFILIGVILGGILFFISEMRGNVSGYSIAVVDEDNTDFSSRLVKALQNMKGLSVNRDKNADITYTIKKGAEKAFKSGDLKELIEVKSRNYLPGIGLINDKAAIRIVNDYIYYNLYERIRKEKDISFVEYGKVFKASEKENEILAVNVISGNGKSDDGVSGNMAVDYGKYIFIITALFIGMYLNLTSFSDLFNMKLDGMKGRLSLAGITGFNLPASEFVLNHIKFWLFVISASLLYKNISFKSFILIFMVTELSFVIFWALERTAKTKEAYNTASRAVLLFLAAAAIFISYFRL